MTTIQTFDASVDLLRAILWQYDSAARLRSLLEAKQRWYDENQRDFWNAWYRDVFDLRTANDFGLSVWAIILDIPLVVVMPATDDEDVFGFGVNNLGYDEGSFGRSLAAADSLTTDQRRLVLQLRYFQLVTRGAVPEINAFLAYIFGTTGRVYVRDNLDMTCTYVFNFVPPASLRQILGGYDVLPRPAGVEINYLVQLDEGFGFEIDWLGFDQGSFTGERI